MEPYLKLRNIEEKRDIATIGSDTGIVGLAFPSDDIINMTSTPKARVAKARAAKARAAKSSAAELSAAN